MNTQSIIGVRSMPTSPLSSLPDSRKRPMV
jgi:hypothetical protein